MIERNLNIDNTFCRGAPIHMIQYEWEIYFSARIPELIEMIKQHIKADSAKTLDESFDTLKEVSQRLITDRNYAKKETGSVFRLSLLGLEDSLRLFLEAFVKEKNLYNVIQKNPKENRDSIDSLIFVMYNSLEEERNSTIDFDAYNSNKKKLRFGYPAVARVIKFIRNIEVVHSINKPAYRSRLEYFNNIYTLSSILILSLYGYTEMLEVWYDTITMTKKITSL